MAVAVPQVMSDAPRVLVTYGSERGGTAEIAQSIASVLRDRGLRVDCAAADGVRDVSAFDAFVVGGALYMMRWHRHARRFVSRFLPILRERPTWFFSSGPLDASAAAATIPPARAVARLANRVGIRGHATFGGRLAPEARGFIAAAMAKKNAGDWRDWGQIQAWANDVAGAIRDGKRPSEVTPVRTPTRWILATLCLVVGVTAVLGGLALVIRPDGSLLHMPASYLAHTRFHDFFVPGLFLFSLVGLGHLAAAWLTIRHSMYAELAGLAVGSLLSVWIVAEMLLLQTINTLQIGTLCVASWIIAESLRRLSAHRAASYSDVTSQ